VHVQLANEVACDHQPARLGERQSDAAEVPVSVVRLLVPDHCNAVQIGRLHAPCDRRLVRLAIDPQVAQVQRLILHLIPAEVSPPAGCAGRHWAIAGVDRRERFAVAEGGEHVPRAEVVQ
jgi:hypothetical protein